jgi:cell wall-associated NlpC family hydrolase
VGALAFGSTVAGRAPSAAALPPTSDPVLLRALPRSLASALTLTALLTVVPAATIATPAAAETGGMDLADATRFTGHDAGESVDHADVAAAMQRIGHHPGSRIDEADERVLLGWARRARTVVDTALAQVGDPYAWGGTGPDRFDCSGLTGFAWEAAGIDLPRTSRAQAHATRAISRSELLPGDLVFNGQPVHHVSVYIGDGKVVDSPRSGYDVKVDPDLLQRDDITKYGRITG